MVANPDHHSATPSRLQTAILFAITVIVSLLAGGFVWEDSSKLLADLDNEHVRISFDWMNFAIPGVLVATVTLAVLTATQLATKQVPPHIRKIGNTLFIAGVLFAVIGRYAGGEWFEGMLEDRNYYPCSAQERKSIFTSTQTWAIHSAFCTGGHEIENLTLDSMRQDLMEQHRHNVSEPN